MVAKRGYLQLHRRQQLQLRRFLWDSGGTFHTGLRIVQRVGGSNTTVKTITNLLGYGSSDFVYARVCVRSDSVAVSLAGGNTHPGNRQDGQWTPITSTVVKCGLGTGRKHRLKFHNYQLLNRTSGTTQCVDCLVCAQCQAGTLADAYQITIAGMSSSWRLARQRKWDVYRRAYIAMPLHDVRKPYKPVDQDR